MSYVIENGVLRAEICVLGAELISLRARGVEQIWQNVDGSWAGHAPVLFPYGGCVQVIVNGKKYPLKKHGFASGSTFSLVERGDDFVRLALCSSERTLALYPYAFRLEICYRVVKDELIIDYQMTNADAVALYFSYGGHESFNLSADGQYSLRFEQKEEFTALCHDQEGMLNGEVNFLGEGTELLLKDGYLANGNTLIFGDIHSRSVTLCTADGEAVATTTFEGIKNLLVWSPSPDRTVCIEPWYNLPDRRGDEGELSQKQFICVEAGQSYFARRAIKYHIE